MQELAEIDRPESPEERRQRRRVRRWKRRARMAGPFVGVTLVLATLSLSVDLIEYQPAEPKERLTDRPLPERVLDRERQRTQPLPATTSVSGASVLGGEALGATPQLIAADPTALDVSLAADPMAPGDGLAGPVRRARQLATPTPPAALRNGR